MADLLQLTVAGLALGAVYGLVAVGYVAVFSVGKVINLAQGEFAAASALVAISATEAGLPMPLALLVAVLAGACVAMLVERLAIAPLKQMNILVSVILTLGAAAVIKAILLLVWGPDAHRLAPLPGPDVTAFGVTVTAQEIWILGTTALVSIAVAWFYDQTLLGKGLRACAQQPVAARLVGISLKRASLVSFGVAGFTAAIAGVLASPIYLTTWESGLSLGLKGFVAAALAGLGSVRGALLGGLLLGFLESMVAGYVDSGLREAVAFVVLIGVLVVRPAGVFGRTAEVRV